MKVLVPWLAFNLTACGENSCELLPDTVSSELSVGPACVRIEGATTVGSGGTLTVAPGTTVYLESGAYLAVEDGGTLVANGTADEPIVFTSPAGRPAAGDWQCLYFGDGSDGSELSYFEARYGGSGCDATAGVASAVVVEAPIRTLSHGIIADSIGSGLAIPQFGAAPRETSDLAFENDAPPSLLVGADVLDGIGDGYTFTGAGDFAQVEGDSAEGGTWKALPVPWHVPAGFTTTIADAPLVVEPGATLLMEGGSLDAWIGVLRLDGTAEAPITIGSAKANPVAGDWGCLWVSSDDVLSHVNVEYGGSGAGCTGANYSTAVFLQEVVNLDQVHVSYSAGSAVLLNNCDDAPTAEWCGPNPPITFEDVGVPALGCATTPVLDVCG